MTFPKETRAAVQSGRVSAGDGRRNDSFGKTGTVHGSAPKNRLGRGFRLVLLTAAQACFFACPLSRAGTRDGRVVPEPGAVRMSF